jgi:aldose 1-epimerase
MNGSGLAGPLGVPQGSTLAVAMGTAGSVAGAAGVERSPFGHTGDGEAVELFTVTNANGLRVRFTNFGGIIVSVEVPDRNGDLGDVTLGFDTLEPYLGEHPFFGAVIGRFGNRIGGGTFELDGERHRLATNDGPNHLHGGSRGFHRVVWQAAPFSGVDSRGAVLSYTSTDGEEGYPGTLTVTVTYGLTDRDELVLEYHATTDRATPVNLTNHAYWNLDGHAAGDVLDHVLLLNASRFTPVDETLIPTGELAAVAGTALDFTVATRVGERIEDPDPQLAYAGGYDHNWVIDGAGAVHAARLHSPRTGRVMDVLTTEPGIQFYSGNFLDGTTVGKGGVVYRRRAGLCLETQHFPDSPNQPAFPSTILRRGEEYRSRTVHRFTVERAGRVGS